VDDATAATLSWHAEVVQDDDLARPDLEAQSEDDPDATDKASHDILMTLRAMASTDDRIIDYFRSVGQGKRPSKPDSIVDFIVPDPIRSQHLLADEAYGAGHPVAWSYIRALAGSAGTLTARIGV
jgi:hypothetical protein